MHKFVRFDKIILQSLIGKATVQFNLAVGFALREEWEKASNIVTQLYRDGQDVSVQVGQVILDCAICLTCETIVI